MNPVIKFTTLFGVLAVELGIYLAGGTQGSPLTVALAGAFLVVSMTFVWRSFYAMRIEG
jgi:K(+)-stimulated pyrophosphate-energized sodium pump